MLCLSISIIKLNKKVNADLKHLVNWLNANRISLFFKSEQNKFQGDLKIKLYIYIFFLIGIHSMQD